MKKRNLIVLAILLCLCLVLMPIETHAEKDGYFTYTVSDGQATITDCDTSISGDLVIPNTLGGYPVTEIGEGSFWECEGLKEVVIPEGVTAIANSAFRECKSLKKVTLPNGLTTIGNGAFSECEMLTSINIPKSVTHIGGWAFMGCQTLSKITLPEGLQEINKQTFAYCNALKDITIPETVTTIGAEAFLGCAIPADFVIHKNVSSIGAGAFRGCSNIPKFLVDEESVYLSVDEQGVLFNADKTVLIQAPLSLVGKYEVPAGVQIIQGGAFAGCTSMTEIVFPDTVTEMGAYALSSIGAASVQLPEGLTVIESGLLISCKNLVSVYIPDSVIRIEKEAFAFNYELENIRFSNNLQYIGQWAFQGVYMESISLPGALQEIAKGAFSECNSLLMVTFYGSAAQWNAITMGEHNEYLQNANRKYVSGSFIQPTQPTTNPPVATPVVTNPSTSASAVTEAPPAEKNEQPQQTNPAEIIFMIIGVIVLAGCITIVIQKKKRQ